MMIGDMDVNFLVLAISFCAIPALMFLLDKDVLRSKMCAVYFTACALIFGTLTVYFATISLGLSVGNGFFPLKIINSDYLLIVYMSFICTMFSLGVYFLSHDDFMETISFGNKKIDRKKWLYLSMIVLFILLIAPFITLNIIAGSIYMGGTDNGMDGAGGVMSTVWGNIIGDPVFVFIMALVSIGGLAKSMAPKSTAVGQVTNVLIVWIPSLTWMLYLMNVIPPNEGLVAAIGQDAWFVAYMVNLLLYGMILLSITGIQMTFQALRPEG